MAELNTAVKYKMNIKHILLNNNELGKISKEQRADQLEVWETDLTNPDFSKYAELCGVFGIRVTKKNELDDGETPLINKKVLKSGNIVTNSRDLSTST